MIRALTVACVLIAGACTPAHTRGETEPSGVASVESRSRGRTLTAPSADPGDSAPGLGTSEPTR